VRMALDLPTEEASVIKIVPEVEVLRIRREKPVAQGWWRLRAA
jgi:hypothetical protein